MKACCHIRTDTIPVENRPQDGMDVIINEIAVLYVLLIDVANTDR